MNRLIALHRSDQTQIISMLGDFREQVGNPQTAVAALAKLPRRHEQGTAVLAALAVVVRQLRFVIESVDVRWTTLHAQKNHPFRAGRKVR